MRTIAFWLSLAVIFTIPWEDMVILSGGGSLNRLIGLGVAGFWLVTIVVTGKLRTLRPIHLAVILFITWNIASLFWTIDLSRTLERLLTYIQLLGMFWLIWDLYTTERAFKAALQSYILGTFVTMGSIFYNYMNGIEAYAYAHGRYSASGVNANEASLILVIGIPIAWYLAMGYGKNLSPSWLRLINFGYIPIAAFAILLTASRGSLVAGVPAWLFILGSISRLKLLPKLLIVFTLIAAFFILQPLVPQSALDRLGTTSNQIKGSDLNGRVAIWKEGIAAFQENPLIGVGSNAFRKAIRLGEAPHNSFLSVLVDLGLIGLTLFGTMIGLTIYQIFQQPKWEISLWIAILFVWFIGAFVHNWEHTKYTWLLLSLAAVGANLEISNDQTEVGKSSLKNQYTVYSKQYIVGSI